VRRNRQREALAFQARAADGTVQQVHRRRADKAGDKGVGRPLVDLERRSHLLPIAVLEDGDAIAHGHRLDLVVGNVDGGGLEPFLQLRDLGAHLHA
jgi:hypothetical protein